MSDVITTNQDTAPGAFDLSPRSLEQAMQLANILADSSIVPKDFIGKPGNVLVAIQWGMELGLKPMQAMQNIAVINGRPSLWGDALLALVLASPVCEYVQEWEENGTAFIKVKRRGKPEDIQSFSDDDAKKAGLIGKQGPWAQYPQRMKKMRARAFALRDNFADVLKGIAVAEEVMDIEPVERDITPRATPAQIASNAAKSAKLPCEERHVEIVRKLEEIATQFGAEALAEEWGRLTKEDRKAIGAEELHRLKALAESEGAPSGSQDQGAEAQREPGSDDNE
ncbi:hypothetical protein [Burkholderia vietnamiensis]|uniref:hypothetical protein n=1 Tax=Burkholderia vietnamiensis TaxID=60552 RepID=UPI001B940F95|nr:hypothetical protein [Burkholderia vietnamiensis]MBR8201662.1 hypothetical protein [Burkholderia vietnamiensis]